MYDCHDDEFLEGVFVARSGHGTDLEIVLMAYFHVTSADHSKFI